MAKTYNTVPDKTVGDVFTEAMWDDSLKTNLNNLIVPAACRAYNNANIAVPNNTFTALTFNSERFDTDGMHSTSVNTGRITVTTPGVYTVAAHVNFASNSTGLRTARIRLNGATVLAVHDSPANSTGSASLTVATIYELALNDYLTVEVFQNSGASLDVVAGGNFSPEFSAAWIGRTS